jgi:hypothetical protein
MTDAARLHGIIGQCTASDDRVGTLQADELDFLIVYLPLLVFHLWPPNNAGNLAMLPAA